MEVMTTGTCARQASRKDRAGTVRVLFLSTGWPSGMIDLASWVTRQGLAETAICRVDGAVDPRLVERLRQVRPHVVGMRIEGGQFEVVRDLVAALRRTTDAEIILGGPTATSHPIEVLDDCGADYVFAGEAEEPLAEFLRLAGTRNSKDRQPEIPGLAYRYGGRTYANTLPADGYGRTVLDTDRAGRRVRLGSACSAARPVPPRELIAENRLDWSLLHGFTAEFDSLYFTGGRGCPGVCTFCARLHGPQVRAKTAEQLIEEIEAADARVTNGELRVTRWDLFKHTDEPGLRERRVSWTAIYDEDFFLARPRAIRFFELWDRSPLRERYRLSLQTNPCSLLTADGRPHEELFRWIDRLKPMLQLGAESFHPDLLARWHKRHNVAQLETVLDALDRTRQDYTVFQLLTDFDSTPEELIDALWLLATSAFRHRRMRVASSPFTIPLYDSDTRRLLEFGGRLSPGRVNHFTDYERPQPGWMDPLTAELADLADAELRFALNIEQRDGALFEAFDAVLRRMREEPPGERTRHLCDRAEWAMQQVKEMRFQAI